MGHFQEASAFTEIFLSVLLLNSRCLHFEHILIVMIRSLTLLADGKNNDSTGLVAVINHLVRSGWEFSSTVFTQMNNKGI